MRRPAPIEIDQADDRNAGGVKTKDVRRRECFCPFGARGQTVRRRELSHHDRGRLVDEITPRHAEDRVFTLPFRRQRFFFENGLMFILCIFSNAFYRRECFCIGG